MTATTLAHFSDPHLPWSPKLAWHQHFSKRRLSAWSWQRGRSELQRPEVLETLIAYIRARKPDQILVTGDIVNFSLPGEFTQARDWLTQLGTPQTVSVVPGNHDALVPVRWEQGLGLWQPWMSGDGASPDTQTQWPYLRQRGDVSLIGVSTAVPTAPLLATGRVGAQQLQRLEALLYEQRGRFRIVMLHHPPAPKAISRRKALTDAAAFRAVLQRAGAELVLHGHSRGPRRDLLPGPKGDILCLGLPSSSAIPNPKDAGSRWQWLRVTPKSGGWTLEIEARVWQPVSEDFAPVERRKWEVLAG